MNKFLIAYEQIEADIKKDKQLISEIELIALLGSAADEEESAKWSDLDVLIVIKSSKTGRINIEVNNKLKIIAERISQNYDFPISFLTHTKDDFLNYVSFEYLTHYSFGKASYPNSDALEIMIKDILEKRGVDERSRRSYCLYHLRHTRFNFLRKYVSFNKKNTSEPTKEIAKLLIDKMIKATDLALNYYNLWPKSKQAILSEATKNLKIDTSILKRALELRKNWSDVSEEELTQFVEAGIKYLLDMIDYIIDKEDNRSTPEENMNQR